MKLALVPLLIMLTAVPAGAETLSGPARVVDGDTLVVGERRVRLFGIDAPEAAQTCTRDGEEWACGVESARQLSELVGNGDVVCTGDEIDGYQRLVAVCHTDRFNLNRTLVEYGWATAFREYSDAYIADETRAKMARRGIWSSTFDLPGSFRLAQQPEAPQRASTREVAPRQTFRGGCVIKGNRSRRGEWIYHLPGMPYYDVTRPEELFCSEADAQAAGYRRAIVR